MTHWVSICSLVFLSCSLSTQKKKLIPIKTDEKFHMQVTLTYVSSTSTVGLISKFPLTFLWGVCHSCYQLSPAFFAFVWLVQFTTIHHIFPLAHWVQVNNSQEPVQTNSEDVFVPQIGFMNSLISPCSYNIRWNGAKLLTPWDHGCRHNKI